MPQFIAIGSKLLILFSFIKKNMLEIDGLTYKYYVTISIVMHLNKCEKEKARNAKRLVKNLLKKAVIFEPLLVLSGLPSSWLSEFVDPTLVKVDIFPPKLGF